MDQDEKCYACGKPIPKKRQPLIVNVALDDQNVYVGPDCYRRIVKAGDDGYQPTRKAQPFGPKLYSLESFSKQVLPLLDH